MATHGDHPDLPASVEALLTEQVSTLFLKAGCLPRTKAGHISELRLGEVEGIDEAWETPQMSELMDAFRDLVDANDDRSDCFGRESLGHLRRRTLDRPAGKPCLGVRRSGVHDSDLGPTRLTGKPLIEGTNGCFRCTVCSHTGKVLLGDHARDVDDDTARTKVLAGRLSEHDRHEHIGEEHLLHRINAEFGHRTERHNPDGIHNDVETTGVLDRSIDRCPSCARHPKIQRDAPRLDGHRGKPVGVACHEGQHTALVSESPGDSGPKAARATGNQDRLRRESVMHTKDNGPTAVFGFTQAC